MLQVFSNIEINESLYNELKRNVYLYYQGPD